MALAPLSSTSLLHLTLKNGLIRGYKTGLPVQNMVEMAHFGRVENFNLLRLK
uniref:Uncharacterized protein n=1 Tax=Medicago truncatula TaxID=3880 RepID=Q2HUP3_MEDTR|nr:hypothetical protein MtrDRAFT_AC149130g14v2 [Medicago truncatula]